MKRLLLLFLVCASVQAISQTWYNSYAPNGRDINCIKIFNHDSVVVAGGWLLADSTRTVFRSENGGLYLWNVPVDANAHWIKSMDFSDKNNGIAVCAGGRMLTTTDGGWNWTVKNAPINRDLNRIFFIDAQNLIIVGGKSDTTQSPRQTILKSTNGGQSWSTVLDQPGKWLKSVYFPTSSIGYAVGDSGTILKTTNAGANWTPVTPPRIRDFNAIWFRDANNGFIVGGNPYNDSIQTILQTADGGNNWTINRDNIASMLRDVHFADATTGYAVGDDATVLKTTDGGNNWNRITISGTLGDEQFNAVRFYDSTFGYVSGKWGQQYIYNYKPAPEAFAAGAIVDTALSVTLSGFVNSHNAIAAYKFVYSELSDFSNPYEQAYAGIIKNNVPEPVNYTFTNLLPDTTYYYYLRAWTHGGTVHSDTFSFQTGSLNAKVSTLNASNVSQTSATLNGEIKGFSIPLNLFFEYGLSPTLGSQVTATPASVNDSSLHVVTATLNSLQANQVYYFRLKAVNGSNNYYGNTLTFYSGNQQQVFTTLQTLPATAITDSGATLNGVVDGFTIPADISFEYSALSPVFNQNNGFNQSITDSIQHNVFTSLSGLTPTTLYYYRIKAQTALGTFYGDTIQFYSGLAGTYAILTKPATAVTETFAQLHGEVSGLAEPADLVFEYGTTTAMTDSIIASPASVNDTGIHTTTAALSSLQPNTLYYYRLRAEISSGAQFYGEIRQVYTSNSPIPNWDFQQWEDITYSLPHRWNMMGEDYEKVPGRSGSALKLTNNVLATLGILFDNGSGSPAFIRGVPFNERPDSISFYANYNIAAGDSAMFLFHLYDAAFNDISTAIIPIGGGNPNGQFKRLSFAIPYNSGLTPDSLVIGFIPTLPEGRQSNNYLIIDDIAVTPASTPVYNGNFENWVAYTNEFLSGWFYPKNVALNNTAPVFVSKSIFNAPDDYAAELQNFYFGNGNWTGTEISNKSAIFDKSPGGFPVYARHISLNGFFKWLPATGDTMMIDIQMIKQGQAIGGGQFKQGGAVSDYTMFDMPITYTVSNLVPDTATITIRSYSKNPAIGDSHLFIDKLSFDGFVGIKENTVSGSHATTSLNLYPNPASTELKLQISKELKKATLTVYDLTGTAVYTKDFSGNNVTVDTQEFAKGFYIASVTQGKERVSKRFIVVR